MQTTDTIDLSNISEKHILDVTCGSRSIWFNKSHPAALYVDKRSEDFTLCWGENGSERKCYVRPDEIADFTDLPYDDNTFDLVVFDPPHLLKVGDTAWLKKKYGKLPDNWQSLIHDGFHECMRVLKSHGTLIFKWCETDIPTRKVIDAIGYESLFGHRSGKRLQTHWMCFMKFDTEDLRDANQT